MVVLDRSILIQGLSGRFRPVQANLSSDNSRLFIQAGSGQFRPIQA